MAFSPMGVKQAKEELEKLHATRQRREMDLEAVLSRLRKVCAQDALVDYKLITCLVHMLHT